MMDMRERKYVKLRTDMYGDTKFKIIDMHTERDLIHYIWTRIVVLAGKVNLAGDLYMSKNIPYTVETLSIEFNREANQIKLALDVFMELEMIELTENNVYIVKNFAKHQNLKVKETVNTGHKEEDTKIKEVKIKQNPKDVIYNNEDKDPKNIITKNIEVKNRISGNKQLTNKISENKVENFRANEESNLEIENKDINIINDKITRLIGNKNSSNLENTICDEKSNNNLKANMPIVLAEKKNKGSNKKKNENKNKKNIYMSDDQEEKEDEGIVQFIEGDEEIPLKEGDTVIWSGLLSDSSMIR